MKGLRKAFAVVVLVGSTQLHAQPTEPPAPTAAETNPSAGAQLSPIEMSTRAAELEASVRNHERHVLHLQALARKDKDVIKLNCINDKYVRLKAEANMFDSQKRNLVGSLDGALRVGNFDAIVTAAANVQKAREEAERCVGGSELGGEASNGFVAPPIVDDPTSGLPFDEHGTVIEPPAYASPYS